MYKERGNEKEKEAPIKKNEVKDQPLPVITAHSPSSTVQQPIAQLTEISQNHEIF